MTLKERYKRFKAWQLEPFDWSYDENERHHCVNCGNDFAAALLAEGRFEKGIVEECVSKHRRGVGHGQPFVAILAVAADLASRIFYQ